MSRVSVEMWTLECNGCGDQLDDLYEDELEAEAAGANFEWVRRGPDHLCKDCAEDDS